MLESFKQSGRKVAAEVFNVPESTPDSHLAKLIQAAHFSSDPADMDNLESEMKNNNKNFVTDIFK